MEISVDVRHCAVCLPPGAAAAVAAVLLCQYTLTKTTIALQTAEAIVSVVRWLASCKEISTSGEQVVGECLQGAAAI